MHNITRGEFNEIEQKKLTDEILNKMQIYILQLKERVIQIQLNHNLFGYKSKSISK